MKLLRLAGFLVLSSLTAQARAEQVEGLVRAVGLAIDAETLITPEKEYQGPKLCGSPMEKQIRHLASLFVRVEGEWKLRKNGERSCFAVKSFAITKMTSGRVPVVGVLSEKNGVYSVTGDGGKATAILDVSPGLKKLTGQKVILDVKSDENAPKPAVDVKETPKVVVTYQAFP